MGERRWLGWWRAVVAGGACTIAPVPAQAANGAYIAGQLLGRLIAFICLALGARWLWGRMQTGRREKWEENADAPELVGLPCAACGTLIATPREAVACQWCGGRPVHLGCGGRHGQQAHGEA